MTLTYFRWLSTENPTFGGSQWSMWVHSAQKVNRDQHSRLAVPRQLVAMWQSFAFIFPILLGRIPVFWVHVQQKTHPMPIIPFSDTPNSGRFHHIPIFFLIISYYISSLANVKTKLLTKSPVLPIILWFLADLRNFARLPSEFGSVHCSHHGVQVNPAPSDQRSGDKLVIFNGLVEGTIYRNLKPCFFRS